MILKNLSESDLIGRFFIKSPNGGQFMGYYQSLDSIRPLLKSKEWSQYITGFYINVAGDFDAVRVSYFTTEPKPLKILVRDFVAKSGLKFLQNYVPPKTEQVSVVYGGEELRFRRFLSTYTLIGLDIMEVDLLNAQRLFMTFRFQVMRAREPYRPHFLRTFENQSNFYNALSEKEKEQFWNDLSHWPNPPQVDWAHLFVNMVLGTDWISPEAWRTFLTRRPPMSLDQINDILVGIGLGFQIPEDWHP